MQLISRLITALGPMRIALLLFALTTILLTPAPGTRVVLTGWEMVSTLLAPVLAPIIFMVLMLDALMSRIMMADGNASDTARERYRLVIWVELLTGAALMIAWLPIILALAR